MYYLIMRYYLSNFQNPHVKENTNLITSEQTLQLILTNSGIIHLNGDKMYDYKFVTTQNAKTINKYIDNYDLIVSGYTTTHNKLSTIQIPIHYKEITIFKKKYKLHEKSETSFYIEKIDRQIHDFYFESSYTHDNKFLKKDILSFLSHFK